MEANKNQKQAVTLFKHLCVGCGLPRENKEVSDVTEANRNWQNGNIKMQHHSSLRALKCSVIDQIVQLK